MAKKYTIAQQLVDVLSHAGVKNCYGIIGDTLNFVGQAIAESQINWVHVRHEETGAFAAGAEAFMTGRLTACAGSCGPGSLHFINGLYDAQRNRAPVIVIASQLASQFLGSDFPQEVDFYSLYQHCSVFCQQVNNPNTAHRIFTQAAQAALNQRGVAVIILPSDLSQDEVSQQVSKIWAPKPILQPSASDLTQLISLIDKGEKIAIYAGIGCRDAHDELIELASLLQAPIVHTSRATDSVAYHNPYQVGMSGIFGNRAGYDSLKECDTLLLLGCGFAWSNVYPEEATIIQIDEEGSRLGLRCPLSLGLVGDIKATLQVLIPHITKKKASQFLDKQVSHYQTIIHDFNQEAQSKAEHSPVDPHYLIKTIDELASEDALFTADVGTPMVWSCRHITMNGKRRLLSSLKHASMANAMPQALGLQQAFPKRQVIALSGDGGIAMLLGDLLTAQQQQLPIKVIIFNNCSLNFVEQEQKSEGMISLFVDLKNGDFTKIAQAAGFYAQTVTQGKDLKAALQALFAHAGPALLNVETDPNVIIMPPVITGDNVKNMLHYSGKAILSGKIKEVIDLVKDNF